MKKSYSTIIVFALLTTGFSLFPEEIPSFEAIGGPTRGVGESTMGMNISNVSSASFIGEGVGDASGYSVTYPGDVNGDGFDDVLIGAIYNDEAGDKAGQTFLFLGKSSGWSMDTSLSSADASFIGESAFDWAGSSITGAGDVNGDGFDDILIGSNRNSEGGIDAGQTYLIFGKSSGWSMDTSLSSADASFIGEVAGDQSAITISGAGDVNGDGFDDFLIGANENDEGGGTTGQTYLIFGKSSGWSMDISLSSADASFLGEDVSDMSGFSVSGTGDVNGDGFDDFLIGAYGNDEGGDRAGQTYLIFGKPSGWSMDIKLSNADASFIGENIADYSGYSLSGAGDVNGDGFDDFLIGAYGNDEGGDRAGQTYLILGKSSGWSMDIDLSNADGSFIGEATLDQSGNSVSGTGDINFDGFNDIIIGVHQNDEGGDSAGQTYLIFGKSSGWAMDTSLSSADGSFIGEVASDVSGYSISSGADVNGDGFDDLLIGAYQNDEGGNGAGQTYLIFGWSTFWIMDTDLSESDSSFIGETAGDESGFSVTGVGDVNGDGFDDILIGAYGNSEGNNLAGQTYLIFGKSSGWSMDISLSSADASFIGEEIADHSGYCISGGGDVNGDGFDDILIGANDNDEGGDRAGQTYLIFGKSSGWSMDTSLSSVDASFIGENSLDFSGSSISGAGDVNGDGFEDFLIGANENDEGGDRSGQTYLIFGKSSGWSMDTSLSSADASFIGENPLDYSGSSVSIAGDLNGDGFHDILIGADENDEGGDRSGQTYLIFGKSSGWSMDTSLSSADASFIGENSQDHSGSSVSGAGDINGDGVHDILIGANENNEGGDRAGQTYLIFGKSSGWSMDTSLSSADASFIGEASLDYSGSSVSSAGDVNGDGFDDILIGVDENDESSEGMGQIYLILGKASEWSMDMNLSSADASFIGEYSQDHSGSSVSSAGDLNGDGFYDILIGANGNDESGNGSGQTYLIFGGGRGPHLAFENDFILSQMTNLTLKGDLEIRWETNFFEDVSNLEVSIYYQRGSEPKEPIIEYTTNSGTYIWNTTSPRVPDGNGYSILIKAKDSNNKSRIIRTFFRFEINNPDPPLISILNPLQYQIVSRSYNIEWETQDGEDKTEDLSVNIWISDDDGENYSILIENTENTGTYLFNSINYPDGERYRVKLIVKYTDGMMNYSISDRFQIQNQPSVEIFKPIENEIISGLYAIVWDSNDPQDLKNGLETDIWLTNGEKSYILLVDDVNSTGYFQFNTTKYPDADGYRLMINVTDTDGVTTSILSGNFSIFNNDNPSVKFLTPVENQTLRGIYEVTWISEDQENESEEMTFTLYYRFEESSIWKELVREGLNLGSYSLNTLSLIEGDGKYELQMILRDPHDGISNSDFINFYVYNPDAPVIKLPYMIGPHEPIRNGKAYFEWRVSDPDPGESENLKIWIFISHDNLTWVEIESGIPNENEYKMNVTGLEDLSYYVKILVSDCQPGDDNMTNEALFPQQIIVNNINDPPTIELDSNLSADLTYSNEITFRWTSSDPDGDPVSYSLYYRMKGDNEWEIIPGASQLTETNFTWNISQLVEGYYQVKIVAKEMTSSGIETEFETITFYVKPILFDIGEDNHEISVNYGMLFALSAGFVVLIIVLVWLLFLFAKKGPSSTDLEQNDISDQDQFDLGLVPEGEGYQYDSGPPSLSGGIDPSGEEY